MHIGLDFFDASINRIAAWVIGTRAKALLAALLEPRDRLQQAEAAWDSRGVWHARRNQDTAARAVWDHYCLTQAVPVGMGWMEKVRTMKTRSFVPVKSLEVMFSSLCEG